MVRGRCRSWGWVVGSLGALVFPVSARLGDVGACRLVCSRWGLVLGAVSGGGGASLPPCVALGGFAL